jgi:uncharacterized protein (DUF433 family)
MPHWSIPSSIPPCNGWDFGYNGDMTATETAPAPTAVETKPVGLDHLIEIREGALGPKAMIAGHRIRVRDVAVWHEDMGMSVDQILENYPQLSLEKVYAALAYYYANKGAIRAKMAEDEQFVRNLRANTPPSKLETIMGDVRDPYDPLPLR